MMISSTHFPHVDITALKRLALATVVELHPVPNLSRRTKGRKPVALNPKISSCEDVIWAGEKMILIEFDPASLPLLGVNAMLAHFPQGRPHLTTQALVKMTASLRDKVNVPRVYAHCSILPNPIGADVVLLEKVPGECLEDIWSTFTPAQERQFLRKLAEILLVLFYHRSPSELGSKKDVKTNPDPAASAIPEVLLSPPFDQGPMRAMHPQSAVPNVTGYLQALAGRMERVFACDTAFLPPHNIQARMNSNPLNVPLSAAYKLGPLSQHDVDRIKVTWRRLASLIPYYTGGFFIPGTLSAEAQRKAYSTLQSPWFGILHSDMQMSRFIVDIHQGTGSSEPEMKVTLTGWEHAHLAPLWSCARLPLFLYPSPFPSVDCDPLTFCPPHIRMSARKQRAFRKYILDLIFDHSCGIPAFESTPWEWIIAYSHGVPERWFEGCISAHWGFRDAVEVSLERLKQHWEKARPDRPFPLPVGKDYPKYRMTIS
ncbi:hypothetical protein B0H10DRAFT_103513 [Mycena sp. CBHHK59/15]|nr:hypothetical protein B0H10DRAFT_103513 [Mycena sp. CBHHK59/15]